MDLKSVKKDAIIWREASPWDVTWRNMGHGLNIDQGRAEAMRVFIKAPINIQDLRRVSTTKLAALVLVITDEADLKRIMFEVNARLEDNMTVSSERDDLADVIAMIDLRRYSLNVQRNRRIALDAAGSALMKLGEGLERSSEGETL